MDIEKRGDKHVIRHAGKIIKQEFDTEDEAWSWADQHIDDQVFDNPNTFSRSLEYES